MASFSSDKGYLRIKYYINRKPQYEYLGVPDTPENRLKYADRLYEIQFNLRKQDRSIYKNHLPLDTAFLLYYKSKPKISKSYKEMFELIRDHLQEAFPGNKTIQQFDAQDVEYFEKFLWKREKVKSDNTVATYFIHLRVLFNFCKKKGYIEENIIPKMEIDQDRIELIPEQHRKIIIAHFKERSIDQYTFVSFLNLTGKRQSDAIALQWSDLTWVDDMIWLRNVKGKRRAYVWMYPKLKKLMYSYWIQKGKPKEGKVFFWKGRSSLHWWNRALKRLNLPPYKMHSIRRTFTTNLLENETTIYDTMKLVGHKDIRTVQKFYERLDAVRLGKEAAKIRRAK